MPDLPTLAHAFRDAGYQAYAAGKLHVSPQRNGIGFDDFVLCEEGRSQYGVTDDYETFLGVHGHAGQQFGHGIGNNQYVVRPWHLAEDLYNTSWTVSQMERLIRRRDPTRPALFYMSFTHPHPPLVPLASYLDMYRRVPIDDPFVGSWARRMEDLPHKLKKSTEYTVGYSPEMIRDAIRAFYALVTQIDHQIRRVIGTLREEGLLESTYIVFTSDHGDMLGRHNLWAKRSFLEWSARVPMLIAGPVSDSRLTAGCVDPRLVGWQDVMPTLLDLCGTEVPAKVEGVSMVGDTRRDLLYGEEAEGVRANRMIHDGRHKLICYPAGNRFRLFDLDEDPNELIDRADDPAYAALRVRLTDVLVAELCGSDLEWLRDGEIVGLAEPEYRYAPAPGLFGQRGTHWPPAPGSGIEIADIGRV